MPSEPPSSHRRSPRERLLPHLALNFLPGLLGGTLLGSLLFFLNPALDFNPTTWLRGAVAFGGALGMATSLFFTAFTVWRAERARRLLPWSITSALALTAIFVWIHASRFAFFVPPGINERLIKAAALLTLTALACFYIALLHTLQRRPYRRRTRLALVALALVSVFAMFERREAFKPRPRTPLPSSIESVPRASLVVVGIDAATLDVILPLASQSELPFFARLVAEGSHARLASLSPLSESALWTTLATGRFPYRHGVLGELLYPAGFLSPGARVGLLPAGWRGPAEALFGSRGRPPDARSRSVLTIWEVLSRLGLSAGVVGWPATQRSPEELEFAFDERYFSGDFAAAEARPAELAERGILFRLGTDELDTDDAAQFGEEVPHAVLRSLAEDLWRESLSLFLLDQKTDLRAFFLKLPGLGEVSGRYFGSYSAVHLEGGQEAHHRQAAVYLTAYYRHLDGFLEQLWQRVEGPKILAIVSGHGVKAPGGWHKLWRGLARKPLEGRFGGDQDGVLLLFGAGIRAGEFINDAELVDVMPTLLYGLRFPIAQDLDGRVLVNAFESSYLARTPLTFVPSYETLAPQESGPVAARRSRESSPGSKPSG